MSEPTKAQLAALKDWNDLLREVNNTSHATASNHIDNRGTNLALAAAIFCGLTLVVVILEFYRQDQTLGEVRAELHDLRAWSDVHNNEINELKNRRTP